MMLQCHVTKSNYGLQRNPLATKKISNNAKSTQRNHVSYQLGRLNKVAVLDLYPVINDLQQILLRDRSRDGHRIIFMKAHAPRGHRYPIHGRVQTIYPIGCRRSTMKGLLAAQYFFHLFLPKGRYLNSRGLWPSRRKVIIGNHLVWPFGPRQAVPHVL